MTTTTIRKRLTVASVMVIAAFTIALARIGFAAKDEDDHDGGTYALGLWGDLPYSEIQATIGVPNLIADMNSQHLAFTAHDGDLKAGNGAPICNDSLYDTAVTRFNSLDAPAIFTPGDNDCTDCDRQNNGVFISRERLDHERQVLFGTPFSLGTHRLKQEVQMTPLCRGFGNTFVRCVENRRWTVRGVTYATLNIQGSCNNLCGDGPDPDEYFWRNTANIVWMQGHLRTRQGAALGRDHVHLAGRPGLRTDRDRRAEAQSEHAC